MIIIKSDEKKEKEIIELLVAEDEELRKQHEIFLAEMAFKQELIDARKKNSLTQKDISRTGGLTPLQNCYNTHRNFLWVLFFLYIYSKMYLNKHYRVLKCCQENILEERSGHDSE